MASIFKRGGRKNRNGRYSISYFDENGKRRNVSSRTADKDAATAVANSLEAEVALKRRGIITPEQGKFAEANQRPLADHITDYLAHCAHMGQDLVHRKNKKTQLRKLQDGTGATRLSDLDINCVQAQL